MRLDADFIPHTHYRVSGWLEERWVISCAGEIGKHVCFKYRCRKASRFEYGAQDQQIKGSIGVITQ